MKNIAAPNILCDGKYCNGETKSCFYHSYARPENIYTLFECRLFDKELEDTETGKQIRCEDCVEYEKTGKLPDMI